MKPLDVKTKFYNAESDEVFLEAQVPGGGVVVGLVVVVVEDLVMVVQLWRMEDLVVICGRAAPQGAHHRCRTSPRRQSPWTRSASSPGQSLHHLLITSGKMAKTS